jgi:hypothetical protein
MRHYPEGHEPARSDLVRGHGPADLYDAEPADVAERLERPRAGANVSAPTSGPTDAITAQRDRLVAQVDRWTRIVGAYEARRFRSGLAGARRSLEAARRALADFEAFVRSVAPVAPVADTSPAPVCPQLDETDIAVTEYEAAPRVDVSQVTERAAPAAPQAARAA